jgi:hypothetical protein
VKAEELCNAVKITLSSWEANMGIIDACCEKLNEKAVQQFYHRENEIHGEIILDAADRLCRAKKTNDSKFGDLVAESEEMKKVLADDKDRVNSYFFTPLIDMVNIYVL